MPQTLVCYVCTVLSMEDRMTVLLRVHLMPSAVSRPAFQVFPALFSTRVLCGATAAQCNGQQYIYTKILFLLQACSECSARNVPVIAMICCRFDQRPSILISLTNDIFRSVHSVKEHSELTPWAGLQLQCSLGKGDWPIHIARGQ